MNIRQGVSFLSLLAFLLLSACNIENIEKYNDDFIGEWRTSVYYSPAIGDSTRSYFTVNGSNSAFGVACKKNDPFVKCMVYQQGKVKYNKASHGIQVGNNVDLIHYVQKEPFINDEGKWEMEVDNLTFYKY